MVGEINFALMDTSAPAKIVAAPLEVYNAAKTNAMAQRQAEQQNQINALALQKAQRDMAEEEAMKGIYRQYGNDMNALAGGLMKGGFGKQGLDIMTKQQEMQKAKIDRLKSIADLTQSEAVKVLANPTPQAALSMTENMERLTGVPNTQARQEISALTTPDEVKQWALGHLGKAEYILGKPTTTSTGSQELFGVQNPLTGAFTPATSIQKFATPGELLSAQTTVRGQDLRNEAETASSPMSPEAIENAAARYNMFGVLPPLGMGKKAAASKTAILEKAAQTSRTSGATPESIAIDTATSQANKEALTQLTKQEAMVNAYEKTFSKNADLVKNLSNQVSRTGIPLVNSWINAGKRAGTGDPELSKFDAAIKATVNEYSKILSGSMGNAAMAESEVKKVESLLNAAQTPQQITALIDFMKQETGNRTSSFVEQKKMLTEGMVPGKVTRGPTSLPAQTVPAHTPIKFLGFE